MIRDREDSEYLEVEHEGVLRGVQSSDSPLRRNKDLAKQTVPPRVLHQSSPASEGQKRRWKRSNDAHQLRRKDE